MELRSLERGFRLTLSRNDLNDPYSSYTIRIEARTAFGSFTGENAGIHFSAFPTFLDRLKEFLVTRSGEARLDLTEEGELIRDPTQTRPLTLTGAFP